MNPEEGRLRPQILDRFGLRIVVDGLAETTQRLEAYKRVQTYLVNPRHLVQEYYNDTEIAKAEIQMARDRLPSVKIPVLVSDLVLSLVHQLKIDSLRAEVTLFEATKAFAALDGRIEVSKEDLHIIAPMALRMRRSTYIEKFIADQSVEEMEISKTIENILA
jgi:magnesium chelatase subunit I